MHLSRIIFLIYFQQYRSNERLKWSLADIINKKVQEVIKVILTHWGRD